MEIQVDRYRQNYIPQLLTGDNNLLHWKENLFTMRLHFEERQQILRILFFGSPTEMLYLSGNGIFWEKSSSMFLAVTLHGSSLISPSF